MSLGASIVWLVLGLVLLGWGGDWLVRGATRIATFLGISPLVIGLTVVAFGTSAPELAVSVMACSQGETDLAIGNVVGSNLFNTFFILGAAALIVPLAIERRMIRFDVPFMVMLTISAYAMVWDGELSRFEGLGLLTALLLYLFLLGRATRQARRGEASRSDDAASSPSATPVTWQAMLAALGILVVGLVLLLAGSNSIVAGAVGLARRAGLSELLIGATIIAAGTSLPEVAASLVAAAKGQRDLAVGNVVGSNILNIGCVLAICAGVSPSAIPVTAQSLHVDLPIVVASAVVCWPIVISKASVGRAEGALLLAGYVFYMTLQVMYAIGSPWAEPTAYYSVRFALPGLTVALCLFAGFEVMRDRSRRRAEVTASDSPSAE
ncbi:MAG: calcium/sodium antiporter [Pirellulaceae bacterium]|nr:calcium/sodium antiporter [Planctomycetales bacterium]